MRQNWVTTQYHWFHLSYLVCHLNCLWVVLQPQLLLPLLSRIPVLALLHRNIHIQQVYQPSHLSQSQLEGPPLLREPHSDHHPQLHGQS
jgi:hypothetical protein